MRCIEDVWQSFGVVLGLYLDSTQRETHLLGLQHTDGLPIDKEQVVNESVTLLQLELKTIGQTALTTTSYNFFTKLVQDTSPPTSSLDTEVLVIKEHIAWGRKARVRFPCSG